MDARISAAVQHRADHFGGMCYVPSRDDFFALSANVYKHIAALSREWRDVSADLKPAMIALAQIGICDTRNPVTRQVAYSGPSFVGIFDEIVTVREPLVVNCFSTSHCPLKCVYCHADDLMQEFRHLERDDDIDNVAATASTIPAMVAVVTGGDPISRPERARRLIDRLAGQQKAIVIDTSGVGDIAPLLPVCERNHVHVRVSIDAVSEVNNRLRPTNLEVVGRGITAFDGAVRTLRTCIDAGLPVTVQTVVCNKNDNESELRNLRDWLVSQGVRHWVLHIAVRGGSARRIEDRARRQRRARGIVPQVPTVYERIMELIADTATRKLPLDIRCTDTGNTPNSVLLIASNGDLFTEGLAHSGKVRLFTAGDARPDRIRMLWHYVDHFGHARRYLNWNPWFYEGRSLNDVCYRCDVPDVERDRRVSIVETEAKYHVINGESLSALLRDHATPVGDTVLQRDEYYDTDERALDGCDFVVRIRKSVHGVELGVKGPRFRAAQGEYSRIELEFEAKSEADFQKEIARRGLGMTWVFEKRRTEYRWRNPAAVVVVDEIPEVGMFVEIEGDVSQIREIATVLRGALGRQESRNYKEVFVAFKQEQGIRSEHIRGAAFAN